MALLRPLSEDPTEGQKFREAGTSDPRPEDPAEARVHQKLQESDDLAHQTFSNFEHVILSLAETHV